MRTLLAVALLVVAAAAFHTLSPVRAEERAVKDIEVGDTPGAFALNDHEGKAVRLGDGKGHGWFVLAFYPKAMTGGCTKEVCSLRDSEPDLSGLKVKAYGISIDDVVSQKQFHTQQKLNFPLLSDPDGSVAKRYAVLPEGKAYTSRVTFVVDPAGVVRHVDRGVQVATHGADLAAVLKKLTAEK
jgi:peroxiredoxin Q/BCP